MDKYIGIEIIYTGRTITESVDIIDDILSNNISHRLIIKEQTAFDKCLKQNDLIIVKRHNSYEWAIISSILYGHSETSAYIYIFN